MFRQSRRSCWRVKYALVIGADVLARTCEWADEIDVARAREAADRAKAILQKKAGDREMDIAQGKLKKAVNRIRIAESK